MSAKVRCPQCERRFDATTGYDGKTLPVRIKRWYCSRACLRTAAQRRRDADTDARVAAILGPDGVTQVIREATETGQPVVLEGLPPARRDGGLGHLGRRT